MAGINRAAFIVFFLFLPSLVAAAGEDFELWRGNYRTSAEVAELPGGERMGMIGISYLVDVVPWFDAGIGAYGAMTGRRGGFLTGGVCAEFSYPVASKWKLGTGIFLGGGGGKSSLVGGGLMARSHVGLLYDAGPFSVGLQYVNFDFPNGIIKDDHAALAVEFPFDAFRLRSGLAKDPPDILADLVQTALGEPGAVRDFLGPRSSIYLPFSGVKNTDGVRETGQFTLVGFGYGRYVSERGYLLMETAGAAAGNADGYAELFFGGGYAFPLFSESVVAEAGDVVLDAHLSIGSGGGGRVDTGGGALSRVSADLSYLITDSMRIGVSAGVVDALRGGFRAVNLGVNAFYTLDFLFFDGRREEGGPSREDVHAVDWRVRLSNQTYRTEDERMRRSRSDRRISLLGVKVDVGLTDAVYLTGQALGAYTGDAGGYAVGLMGPGIRSGRLFGSNARIFAEALFGASGGGGVSVGGGSVIQPAAGILYDIGDRLSVELSVGKIKALHGELSTTVYDAGLVYRFSTLNR